jgi:hypothetical protein
LNINELFEAVAEQRTEALAAHADNAASDGAAGYLTGDAGLQLKAVGIDTATRDSPEVPVPVEKLFGSQIHVPPTPVSMARGRNTPVLNLRSI